LIGVKKGEFEDEITRLLAAAQKTLAPIWSFSGY